MKFFVFILAIALVLFVTYLSRKPRLVEKLTRVATDADRKEAMRAFLKKKCLAANHQWNESPDGASWDCHYSEATCKANSYWPEVSPDDDPHGVARMYQYWNQADEKCYLGYGSFRKKCEDLGLNWVEDAQTCRVTPQYCSTWMPAEPAVSWKWIWGLNQGGIV